MMNNKISIVGGKLAGNTFHGTKEQVMLAKHGWKCAERKKNGCVWHVRWYDPIDGEVWNQGTAVVRTPMPCLRMLVKMSSNAGYFFTQMSTSGPECKP